MERPHLALEDGAGLGALGDGDHLRRRSRRFVEQRSPLKPCMRKPGGPERWGASVRWAAWSPRLPGLLPLSWGGLARLPSSGTPYPWHRSPLLAAAGSLGLPVAQWGEPTFGFGVATVDAMSISNRRVRCTPTAADSYGAAYPCRCSLKTPWHRSSRHCGREGSAADTLAPRPFCR